MIGYTRYKEGPSQMVPFLALYYAKKGQDLTYFWYFKALQIESNCNKRKDSKN